MIRYDFHLISESLGMCPSYTLLPSYWVAAADRQAAMVYLGREGLCQSGSGQVIEPH